MIEGRTRITLTSPEGTVQIADVEEGGLWYFPKGWGHSIEGIGPGTARFMLVFNNGAFKEGSTFSITDWLSHTPAAWVGQNLGLTPRQVAQLPRDQVYISRRPPAPGPLAFAQKGSTMQVASAREFPASFNMAGAIIHLEPGAMRALHWHPNADEWQFVLKGSYDLSVFAAEGKASVSSQKQGDVGYVPMGYGHALRNSSSGPTDVLVVFNDGDYQSINLNDWLATNPTSVVANNLQIPVSLADQLPKRNSEFR